MLSLFAKKWNDWVWIFRQLAKIMIFFFQTILACFKTELWKLHYYDLCVRHTLDWALYNRPRTQSQNRTVFMEYVFKNFEWVPFFISAGKFNSQIQLLKTPRYSTTDVKCKVTFHTLPHWMFSLSTFSLSKHWAIHNLVLVTKYPHSDYANLWCKVGLCFFVFGFNLKPSL